jgi:hypothetical protein
MGLYSPSILLGHVLLLFLFRKRAGDSMISSNATGETQGLGIGGTR